MAIAKKALKKVERRWERRFSYLHDKEKHSLWRETSVVQREQNRLWDMDVELCKAKLKWLQACKRWSRWRAYYLLQKRYLANPKDVVVEAFYLRAQGRIKEPLPQSDLLDMLPGRGQNLWEHNARQFGLAIAYGLEWSSAL